MSFIKNNKAKRKYVVESLYDKYKLNSIKNASLRDHLIHMSEKEAESLIIKEFDEDVESHKNGSCNCELVDGGYGFCYFGQFLEGCVSALDIVMDFQEDFEELLIN